MSRQWKPGDVATFGNIPRFYIGNAKWATYLGDIEIPLDDPRPLVVIDPEDREQVARAWEAFANARLAHIEADKDWDGISAMQDALRSLIEPPKPEEPTGLGAVVEDAEGIRWVRTPNGAWFGPGRNFVAGYYLLDAVRVLAEGVAS